MRSPTHPPPRLDGLAGAAPVRLERWFAGHGPPPLHDLARSGATPLTMRELLHTESGDAASLAALFDMPLDYGDGRGDASLRDAIAVSGAARTGDEVVVTHGAVEALLLTCASLAGTRRRMLVGVPAYEALRRMPAAVGAEVVEVPVWHAGRDALDLGRLHDMVEDGVAAVLLNTPDNPTGAVAVSADLEALAVRCAAAGAVLVVDEVAMRTLDATASPVCSLAAFASGCVVGIGDVSKSCGLGGLRVGWMTTASAALRDAAATAKDLTTVGNAVLSESLAGWALRRRDTLVGRVRTAAGCNLDALRDWIAAHPGTSLTPPRDGLVAFPRLAALATRAAADRLRREHGVALVPGALFGVAGHVRIGLGLDPALFAGALGRLDAALRSPAG